MIHCAKTFSIPINQTSNQMALNQTYLYYGLFHATSSLLFVADEVTFTITVIIIFPPVISEIQFQSIFNQINQIRLNVFSQFELIYDWLMEWIELKLAEIRRLMKQNKWRLNSMNRLNEDWIYFKIAAGFHSNSGLDWIFISVWLAEIKLKFKLNQKQTGMELKQSRQAILTPLIT